MSKLHADHGGLKVQDISTEITTATPLYSKVVDLKKYAPDGFMALQVYSTGGSLQIEIEATIDGINYIVPNGASDVVSAHTAGHGLYLVAFGMPVASVKFLLTASGSSVYSNIFTLVQ